MNKSEIMRKVRASKKSVLDKGDQFTEKSCKPKLNVTDRVCVIITQKKNNSWVEDLDALEKLTRNQRVYH